jgi:hypothetical protein
MDSLTDLELNSAAFSNPMNSVLVILSFCAINEGVLILRIQYEYFYDIALELLPSRNLRFNLFPMKSFAPKFDFFEGSSFLLKLFKFHRDLLSSIAEPSSKGTENKN